MIVTLYLISANVYNSVDAPHNRGFSYIEVWMLGSQFPILLALFEYGFVLYLQKVDQKIEVQKHMMEPNDSKSSLEEKIKHLDFVTMVISLSLFVTFVLVYWIVLPKRHE